MKMKAPRGFRALTPNEILKMDDYELVFIHSICYRNGRPRYDTNGIIHFKITEEKSVKNKYYTISWSSDCSDPEIIMRNLDDKIEDLGDGEWSYGLYIKIK